MRVVLACAAMASCVLGWLAEPLTTASQAAADRAAASPPVTRIAVRTGSTGDRVFDGVGAVLGGGGNARFLLDYPARQRDQILDYLFKPGYGASLQILKLEIGGDADSSDGAEPSIEHTRGHVNCRAGYEFSIAKRAVALHPGLLLYGLQWAGPGWVRGAGGPRFTQGDIRYLVSWLGCARRRGLTISYLGGWNESDRGDHPRWFRRLRGAMDSRGFRRVQLVAADSTGSDGWHYVGDHTIAILGAHNVCGKHGIDEGRATCNSPWTLNGRRSRSSQPMWASELGGMSSGAQRGCREPCAPTMDRSVIRGYVQARLTGFLEWPALDSMPPGLPYGNRGLVTADQPWSGSYQVNAMTWAIAQLTQFAAPPGRGGRVRWRYVNSGSGMLGGAPSGGSYVTLVRRSSLGGRRPRPTGWSTIIEATTATAIQRADFRLAGPLARRTVHVWASNFNPDTGGPRHWFMRERSIRPSRSGRFSLTIRPGWVYSLTTTTGQGKGSARGSAPAPLRLPVTESLASAGRAAGLDDEPMYLAAQQGAFELAPCRVPDRGVRTCTEQKAMATPVFWHRAGGISGTRFPYAVIGDADWSGYQVSADVLLPSAGASAGLIGRFSCRMVTPNAGAFDGYVFNVAASGAWTLVRNANPRSASDTASCAAGPVVRQTLASGAGRPLRPGTWHRLALSMAGSVITASVDGRTVSTVSDATWTSGPAGIEAGGFAATWPRTQYSHLTITGRPAR